jgi:Holliday junction resolvase-like predicted endonuclease
VGPRQQRRLHEAAELLMARDDSIRQVRFDVIAVSGYAVRHLPAAF